MTLGINPGCVLCWLYGACQCYRMLMLRLVVQRVAADFKWATLRLREAKRKASEKFRFKKCSEG